MSTTRLENLGIDEISGVDSPANQTPGWIVMKSEDQNLAVQAASQMGALYATLGGASVLEGAPDEVIKARKTLEEFIEKQLSEPEPEPTLIEKMKSLFAPRPAEPAVAEPAPAVEPEPVAEVEKAKKKPELEPDADDEEENSYPAKVKKSDEPVVKAEDVDTLREAVVKVLDRLEAIEQALTGSAQGVGQENTAPVSKAVTLTDAIVSAAQGNRVTLS